MFNFLYEIIDGTENEKIKSNDFRYINFGNKLFYIEGFKEIVRYDTESVIVRLNGGELTILGQDFKMKELSKNTFKLSGNINKIDFYGV